MEVIRRYHRRLSRSGFSLIELVAVMTVAAALTILVAPSVFSLMGAHGLSAGIREVSNHLVNARSEAIAKHTLTRFVVAKTWPEEDGGFSKFSVWRWNPEHSEFEQVSKWGNLPKGVVFETELPDYVLKSNYALNDATSVIGEYALSLKDASIEVIAFNKNLIEAQFVEFLPTGAARIPGGTLSKVIFVLVEGEIEQKGSGPIVKHRGIEGKSPDNWAQVNLDTLTGRVRIYRP